jgi:hypothetical protein
MFSCDTRCDTLVGCCAVVVLYVVHVPIAILCSHIHLFLPRRRVTRDTWQRDSVTLECTDGWSIRYCSKKQLYGGWWLAREGGASGRPQHTTHVTSKQHAGRTERRGGRAATRRPLSTSEKNLAWRQKACT